MVKILAVLSLLFFTGCGGVGLHSKLAPTTAKEYPPYSGVVNVYYDNAPEGLEYDEIGIVSSQGGVLHQEADLVWALQQAAAKYGANAVIVTERKEEYKGRVRNMFGKAIRIHMTGKVSGGSGVKEELNR